MRENLRASKKEFSKTEDDLKSLQSVGQIIGEVLRHLDNERCKHSPMFYFIYRTDKCGFGLYCCICPFCCIVH